jgi:DNA (cytosine-5)-methyltransferase 1
MDTILSIDQVANHLKLSAQQVRSYCRSGKLKAMRVNKSWIIPEAELERFKSTVAQDHPLRSKSKRRRPIALSFFSGALGLDIGLEEAGFEVLLACEIDKACRRTIQANKPNIALLGDINDYSSSQIMEAVGMRLGDDVDLIIGGPPCQAFSTAGKRQGFKDQRGNVFLTYIERALEIKPKFLVIENVRGLLSCPLSHRPHESRGAEFPDLKMQEMPGGALMNIITLIQAAGYGISFNLYNAANFGSPQNRERVVIVCSRDGKKMPYLMPTNSENGAFGLPKWNNVRYALKGLPKKNCHHVNFPENRLRFYRLLKQGQYWKHLPQKLQKEALGKSYHSGGGKTGFLRRLAWDKPSPTLVTYPAMPATDLAHPIDDRPLSVEEYKRIQEFPDTWEIVGSLTDQYRQIGNAVPISLGKAIGILILNAVEGQIETPPADFPYSRYKNTDDVNWIKNYKVESNKIIARRRQVEFVS